MKKQTLYYVASARMPNEKAYGIQMAKMCEALIEAGVDLTLVVPRRGAQESVREFYGLKVDVPTLWLPALELHRYKRFGYFCMTLSFMISYSVFLWYRYLKGERFLLYTVDVDRYSSFLLALIPVPLFSEMHGAKPRTFVQRVLFWRVRGVIAINEIIVKELKKTFMRSGARFLVEQNGVDLESFSPQDKAPARAAVGLPDVPVVLYAGRFYDWKGLEIIPRAAALTPDIRWQIVGGTQDEFAAVVEETLPKNLYFSGGRPHKEMPLWIAAADAVVVLGTKRDEQSYRWTSPMKLFEYMAAGRPIVASGTPALKEILSTRSALLYEPDNAEDLANKVRQAVSRDGKHAPLIAEAARAVQSRTWSHRAQRVLHFINSTLHEPAL